MKACEDFMADDKAVEGLLRRHFATDDLVHVIKNFEKKERPGNYVYANKTDEEIKEMAVKRGMKQLKEGLKVLREKYDEQQKFW
jgi:hypothetical protein